MYIDNPVIMISGNDSSYVIYGEPQYLDFNKTIADNAKPFFNKDENQTDKNLNDIKEEDEGEEDDENVEQGDIKDEDIQTLIDYCKCSRGKAIKTLK